MPSEAPVVFHNASSYDYHYIIKELGEKFEGKFECLEENKEKYKPFCVPIEKIVIKIDKDGNESAVTILSKIKFVDSARFRTTSLSNLVDNLTEGIRKTKYKDCDCFLEYESVKDNSIKYKGFSCNKSYSNKIDKELKKSINNAFKFSNNNINKFFLLLKKGVYLYECMDEWEKFNKTSLPEKEEFCSNLNMENITDID